MRLILVLGVERVRRAEFRLIGDFRQPQIPSAPDGNETRSQGDTSLPTRRRALATRNVIVVSRVVRGDCQRVVSGEQCQLYCKTASLGISDLSLIGASARIGPRRLVKAVASARNDSVVLASLESMEIRM